MTIFRSLVRFADKFFTFLTDLIYGLFDYRPFEVIDMVAPDWLIDIFEFVLDYIPFITYDELTSMTTFEVGMIVGVAVIAYVGVQLAIAEIVLRVVKILV